VRMIDVRIFFGQIFLGQNSLKMTASQLLRRSSRRLIGALPVTIVLLTLQVLVGCTKATNPAPSAESAASKETGLETIPAADPTKFPKYDHMGDWKNPYLVVRDDGIGMVDLSNHEVHILTPEQVPAELASLGAGAWPYGRVVLVTQAMPKDAGDQTKAEIRKNRGLLVGTLKELDVQMKEFP
jgi:hypothetical protein